MFYCCSFPKTYSLVYRVKNWIPQVQSKRNFWVCFAVILWLLLTQKAVWVYKIWRVVQWKPRPVLAPCFWLTSSLLSSSSPPQLMLSKVFTARTGSSIYGSLNTWVHCKLYLLQMSNMQATCKNTEDFIWTLQILSVGKELVVPSSFASCHLCPHLSLAVACTVVCFKRINEPFL